MYINEMQIINGQEYDIDHETFTTNGQNKEDLLVCAEESRIVGIISIDHNTESVSVKYRVNEKEDVDGHYSYHELPKSRMELAAWLVNTHPEN